MIHPEFRMGHVCLNKKDLTEILCQIHTLSKGTPPCRVLQSFEPAFAGGFLPRNFALAQAYRVIPVRSESYMIVLAQNVNTTSRTQQNYLFIPQIKIEKD